ncbi:MULTISPECIES: hypothetical protein [Streptomyces]|uniref:Uncharacterized protein n=1 Tax=Streptomyces chartreusis NRRL 3882 TaxID=1079985 RepID=A0A2N9AZV8_STRCX|nr:MULTISPECIES: hypothetical protein [Streptomyces]MYS95588.1 hypothetical protein [Streptomyces sp. SID5464]SOR76610.1 hypothetical protein SCNRRL3882_0093 [Streptomyces chartreusis NRRL 3882]
MTIVERRRALLDEALATGGGAQLESLTSESARLAAATPRDLTDRACQLALLARLATLPPPGGPQLMDMMATDPALLALGRAPALTGSAAQAVAGVAAQRRAEGERVGLAEVPALRAAAGGDLPFEELAGVAHARWLATAGEERPYLERDVAVLLPARLETLVPPDGDDRQLWLRIIPDEASILRHDPTPKPVEASRVAAMWQTIHAGLTNAQRLWPFPYWLDTPVGQRAWETLCTQVGPGRAAWLARACYPKWLGDTVTVNTAQVADVPPEPNRVGGFPERLEVWLAFGEEQPILAATTQVDRAALRFDVIGTRRAGPDADPVHESDRWWVSWQAAKDVGLGVEVPLPPDRSLDDLRTLYVIGIGDEAPEVHFRARVEAGEMATLPLGAPTNAVDGAQAASLGQDPALWRRVAQDRLHQTGHAPDESILTCSLAGYGAKLPAMPLAPVVEGFDATLVRALWPALWGHQLRDLWGCVDDADGIAAWAARNLRPEGPLPPLRIDQQPYGLLPVAAMGRGGQLRWQVSADEDPLASWEPRLCQALLAMRAHWAATARGAGTAVGANTARLLDLISRDGVSAGYAYRPFLAVELWAALYGSMAPFDQQRFDDWVHSTFSPVKELLGRDPTEPPGVRQMVTGGSPEPLAIPLVVPTIWPHWFYEHDDGHIEYDENGKPVPVMTVEAGIARLLATLLEYGHRHDQVYEMWRGVLPDSLLVRLALHASVLSAAAAAQSAAGAPAPLREPLISDTSQPTVLTKLSNEYDPQASHDHPAGKVRTTVRDGLERLAKIAGWPPERQVLAQLERAFRATLDTATHRIDPWLTGMAARRLEHLRDRPESRFRLGVYGWVDGPLLGTPGPTEGGLLHAPSHAQALTAAILRDKSITEHAEEPSRPDLWSMQLDSRQIRTAEELAEEVRLGSHVHEALGRRVEHIIGVRTPQGPVVEATSRIDVLRQKYPMRTGRAELGRVCHGPDALAGLLGPNPPLGTTPEQRTELEQLQAVLDTYGDLLVAEAVHQVVSGQADRAGAAMDAAAGLTKPPTMAFTETPLDGEGLSTAAVAVIPYKPAPNDSDPAIPAARLADASVADALPALVGQATTWTWQAPHGNQITLNQLGLEPADTLSLSSEQLDDLARAALGAEPEVKLSGSGRSRHELARDVVQALGGTPLFLRDIAPSVMSSAQAEEVRTADAGVLADLRTRYTTLRDSAQRLIDELAAARAGGDASALHQALFRALRWGVTPLADDNDPRALYRLLTQDPGIVADLTPVAVILAQRAEEAMRARLNAAPAPNTEEPLGQAIAELAAPSGQLAVLSGIDAGDFAQAAGLHTEAPDPSLDTEWLTVAAAVRPRLAAVEALQLTATYAGGDFPGFTGWTSSPGDPWQTTALEDLRRRRQEAGSQRDAMPRFVAAYTVGSPAWAKGQRIAASLLDAWSETAPNSDQVTTATFGFNGPAARAQQAILLAVPSDLDAGYGARLDTPELIEVLAETRELAHARAADPDAIGSYLAAVPMTAFGATGRSQVRLETGSHFPL